MNNPVCDVEFYDNWKNRIIHDMGLGAFAASELDKVFSGYQPR
jgi:hypothetical protein